MLKSLFSNRLFLGVLAFFVLMIVGGTLYLRHIKRQGQIELERTQERLKQWEAQQKQTEKVPEGDTAQGGHFHADGTWHAEARETSETTQPSGETQSDGVWYPDNYTQADIAADLAGEGAATDEEYQRRAMKNLVNNYLREHREKYPDCTEHEAILADAIAKAEWVLVDERHVDRYNQLNTEHDFLLSHLKPLLEKYNHRPAYEATHIPEPERLNDVERIKTLMADMKTNREQMNNLMREKPISPKPMHTH